MPTNSARISLFPAWKCGPFSGIGPLVTALPQAIEVLIGLDVLRGCKFMLDGPANKFSLEF